MPYFDEPVRWVKIQTTSKNTHQLQYFTPKTSNKLFIILLLFFSAKSFYSFLVRRESKADREAQPTG